MIYFNCPDFYNGEKLYGILPKWMKDSSGVFYDDIKIKSVFGCYPNMIWNGGSVQNGGFVEDYQIQSCVDYFYQNDISIKLTLTNPCLVKEDLYDRYCNRVVKLMENEKNVVIVSSDMMEDYIRNKYPMYKIHRSIIASEQDSNYVSLLKKYDEVVLPRRLTKNFDFLNTIPVEYRNRLELLCNDPCPVNCPNLYSHYAEMGKEQLYEKNYIGLQCPTIPEKGLKGILDRHLMYEEQQIMPCEIYDGTYTDLGYCNFKLSGRGDLPLVIQSICKYFVKPEYVYEFMWNAMYLL